MLGTHGQWAVRVFSVQNSNVITSVPWNLYFECQIRWLETFILVLTTLAGQDRGSNPDQPHTVRRISVYCTTILKTFRIKTLRAINRYVRMFASLYYHLQLSLLPAIRMVHSGDISSCLRTSHLWTRSGTNFSRSCCCCLGNLLYISSVSSILRTSFSRFRWSSWMACWNSLVTYKH